MIKRLGFLEAQAAMEGRLSPEDQQEVADLRKDIDSAERIEQMKVGPWKVRYIVGKGFSLAPVKRRRGENAVYFFDAAQFFASSFGGAALDACAQKYLGDRKSAEELGIDRVRIGEEDGYYEARRDLVIRYCIKDAELTARLFRFAMRGFERLGVPLPEHPWSKASVSKAMLKDRETMESTQARYSDLELTSAHTYWRTAYRGGVFLSPGLGRWRHVVKHDLVSAYPAAMVTFPSLEGSRLVRYNERGFDEAYFRFYRITAPATPRLALRDRAVSRLQYTRGERVRSWVVTEPDLLAMEEFGDPYEIADGVGILCRQEADRPLKFLEDIFAEKAHIKETAGADSPEYLSVKILLNGVYGLLAQKRPVEGEFTNYIYASYVTAMCRYWLWSRARAIEERGGKVLFVATDGLISHGGDLSDLPHGSELGQWEVEPLKEVVIFGNGIYAENADGNAWSLKRRGMPTLSVDALEAAGENELLLTRKAPVKLRSALIQQKTERIGEFLPRTVTFRPAESAARSGFIVPADLARAPLRDYFTHNWLMDYGRPFDEREEGLT